jgi:predicted RNase H-like nuclease
MAVVLGIDAAWTERGSSAVALLCTRGRKRRILAVAPSYSGFIGLTHKPEVEWKKPPGGAPDVAGLLKTARELAEAPVDVVAVDMPMSHKPITGYRTADRKLSSAFGAAQVSTHTANVERPGCHGKRITTEFVRERFHLATTTIQTKPSLIEVFPLAALVRLMCLPKRPAYKATKTSRYWPDISLPKRKARLLDCWRNIEAKLRVEVGELPFDLPTTCASLASLKPFEDALDAVICAWAGACFAEDRAEPFGDGDAAIWVPCHANLE